MKTSELNPVGGPDLMVEDSQVELQPKPRTILLVEDEISLARSLKRVLEKNGFNVIMVHDAGDARQAFSENKIDLAILDLALPGESGVDLFKQLRSAENTKDLPVIVQSGFADRLLKHVMALKPLQVLQKPFPMNDFIWAIQEALKMPKA